MAHRWGLGAWRLVSGLRGRFDAVFFAELFDSFGILLESVHLFLVFGLSVVNPVDNEIEVEYFSEYLVIW